MIQQRPHTLRALPVFDDRHPLSSPDSSMDRIDLRLRELQQELIETRNLTIKTDHAVRSLTGEMRELTRSQEAMQKRTVWSSATAYILFTILAVGGLFLFFNASSSRAKADSQLVQEQVRQFEARIDELQQEIEHRNKAEKEAWGFYELLQTGSDEEIVERFPKVKARLVDRTATELFQKEVDRRRQALAADAYAEGVSAYSNKKWGDARAAFERALNYQEFAPYNPELNYYLGDALYHLGDHASATRRYNIAIGSSELSPDLKPLGTYRLGESLRAIGRDREALEVYKSFTEHFSTHSWKASAERRIESLERKLALDE